MATFDPNRVGPGTFELVRDATTGNYSIKEVGFTKISPLNLPDLDTTAATTTATQTKTATDTTGDTLSQQTKMAFNMPDGGRDNQPMTTGSMLQQARQTSDMLSDTFANTRQRMTTDDAYRGVTSPLEIKDPTATVFGRPREGTIDQAAIDRQREIDRQRNLGLDEPTVQQTATERVGKPRIRGPQDLEQPSQTTVTDANKRFLPSNIATRSDQGEMVAPGIDVATPPQTALDMDRFAGVSQMGALAGDEKDDVKPVKKDALQTISTSLRTTGDAILNKIKTPTMMALEFIGKPRGESAGAVALNKNYFTDRGDGRIGGNPTTDLYAGMNRVSAFGNLEKAGEKRIARREQTIATKNVSQKFIDDTNRMKEQQANYKAAKKSAPVTGTTKPGESGGSESSGKSIVCTAMYQTTGLEDWKKAMKIWYIYQKKYLTIQHQEGYHKLFKPFVKGMHKSKIIKAIGAHVAKHRTQHLKHVMFNSKPSLLGKVYNKILEPICYWVGKI